MAERDHEQGCPAPKKSCDYPSMVHGKLTIQEINSQQCQLMMNHRERAIKSGTDLPTHQIDLQWVAKYAKRFRDDLVKLGLANLPK